jgi:hypothetical protein
LRQTACHPSWTVLHDLCSYGAPGECKRCALYLFDKAPGSGRRDQIAQADILIRREDTLTVELIVEVDFRKDRSGSFVAPRPKDLTGLLLTLAAANCHTPSNDCTPYRLQETVVVVVSAYSTLAALQNDQRYACELFSRFHVAERGVRELCVCGGPTQEAVERSFQELIRARF